MISAIGYIKFCNFYTFSRNIANFLTFIPIYSASKPIVLYFHIKLSSFSEMKHFFCCFLQKIEKTFCLGRYLCFSLSSNFRISTLPRSLSCCVKWEHGSRISRNNYFTFLPSGLKSQSTFFFKFKTMPGSHGWLYLAFLTVKVILSKITNFFRKFS